MDTRRRLLTPLRIGIAGITLISCEMLWSAWQDYRAAQVFKAFPGVHVYPGLVAIRVGEIGVLLCFAAFIWHLFLAGRSVFSRRRAKLRN